MNGRWPRTRTVSVAGALLLAAGCSSGSGGTPGAPSDAGIDATPLASRYASPAVAGSDLVPRYGEAGAPTACTAAAPVSADLVRACVLRTGCIPEDPPYRLSDCLTSDMISQDDLPDCIRAAPDCAHMNNCLSSGFLTQPCMFGDYGGHCYGNTFVSCGGTNVAYFQDCTKRGTTCYEDDPDAGTGSSYGCVGNIGATCSSPDTTGSCAGTILSWCQFGVVQSVDCSTLGKDCVTGLAGGRCGPTQPACTTPGASSCTGGAASNCSPSGTAPPADCTRNGLLCTETSTQALCVAPGCTPDQVGSCQESCDGPYANVCAGGARVTIDCRKYGFDRCQTYTSAKAVFHGDYAVCVPF